MSFVSYPFKVDVETKPTPQEEVKKPPVYIREQVNSGHFPKPHRTPRDIDKFNSVNVIHLLTWYDENALIYDGKMLILKEHQHCIVLSEGVYDTETYHRYRVIDVLVSRLMF